MTGGRESLFRWMEEKFERKRMERETERNKKRDGGKRREEREKGEKRRENLFRRSNSNKPAQV